MNESTGHFEAADVECFAIETDDRFEAGFDERLLDFLERLNQQVRTVSRLHRTQVTDRERAEQLAVEIAHRHSFHDGVHVLLQALQVSRHHRTRLALEELLKLNVTPEELQIVLELRDQWRAHPEFSVVIGGPYSGGGARREFLPYQLALRLTRLFTYCVEVDEVLEYVHRCLTLWRDREDLLRRFPVFQWFLSEMVARQTPIRLYAEVSCGLEEF